MAIALFPVQTISHENHNSSKPRADSHAPIGIMGDHYHKAGELMFSYRYMNMGMDGLIQGSDEIATESILATMGEMGQDKYMNAPETMNMQMHMLGIMYSPADFITLMVMLPYSQINMEMAGSIMNQDQSMMKEMETSGLADISISAILPIFENKTNKASVLIGSTLPTGEHNETMSMMEQMQMRMPYPMQVGIGVVAPFAALNYSHYFGSDENDFKSSLGTQFRLDLPLGENEAGWSPGSRFRASLWYSILPTNEISISAISSFQINEEIEDPAVATSMNPLANSENTGRSQFDLGLGANYILPENPAGMFRLAGQIAIPVYQKVEGLQMQNTYQLILGLQYSPTF